MNWASWLILIPVAIMVGAMVVVIRQSPNKETRVGGYFNISVWLVFFILHLLRKSGLINWPEVVIFIVLFVIFFSLIVKSRKDAEQMTELRKRLEELENAAASSNNKPI